MPDLQPPKTDEANLLDEWLVENLFGWKRREPPLNGWWKTPNGRSVSPIDWTCYTKSLSGTNDGMMLVIKAMHERMLSERERFLDLLTADTRKNGVEQKYVIWELTPWFVAKTAREALGG